MYDNKQGSEDGAYDSKDSFRYLDRIGIEPGYQAKKELINQS